MPTTSRGGGKGGRSPQLEFDSPYVDIMRRADSTWSGYQAQLSKSHGITVPLQWYDIPLPRQQPNNPAGSGIAAEISGIKDNLESMMEPLMATSHGLNELEDQVEGMLKELKEIKEAINRRGQQYEGQQLQELRAEVELQHQQLRERQQQTLQLQPLLQEKDQQQQRLQQRLQQLQQEKDQREGGEEEEIKQLRERECQRQRILQGASNLQVFK